MDPKAIIQAGERLERARAALVALHSASSFEEADNAWTDLLTQTQTIYAKLEQGSKVSGKSSAWFGNVKTLQKRDPLLRYIKFARNSEEHGLDRSTVRDMGTSILGRPMAFGERVPMQVALMDAETRQPAEPWRDAAAVGPELKLITAYDRRFGDKCEPPQEHLGEPIKLRGTYARDVADLALAYLETLFAEAAGFV